MNLKTIRWKQRFANYKKSFAILKISLDIPSPSEVEIGGVIQFFEITFELAWKCLKDFLEAKGYSEIKAPRDVLKQSFQDAYIQAGEQWLAMLDTRNETTHFYDKKQSLAAYQKIKSDFYPLLNDFKDKFSILESENAQ